MNKEIIFRIGDHCQVIKGPCCHAMYDHLVGRRVVIHAFHLAGQIVPSPCGKIVAFVTGIEPLNGACFCCLKKLPPEEERGSWDEIEKTSGWRPLKQQIPESMQRVTR